MTHRKSRTKPDISADRLRSLLHYDPKTGLFTWKKRANAASFNARCAGRLAGNEWTPAGSQTTYIVISIYDWPFLAHRLAVLYMTGDWPPERVDHRDLDGTNNKWTNIRTADASQNAINVPEWGHNTSGHTGVHVRGRAFEARIQVRGTVIYLGRYRDITDAIAARLAAEREHFGEFARVRR